MSLQGYWAFYHLDNGMVISQQITLSESEEDITVPGKVRAIFDFEHVSIQPYHLDNGMVIDEQILSESEEDITVPGVVHVIFDFEYVNILPISHNRFEIPHLILVLIPVLVA